MKNYWDDNSKEILKKLLLEGNTYSEIAILLNRSKIAVRKKATSIGMNFNSLEINLKPACDINNKYCIKCTLLKIKIDFPMDKNKKDGLGSMCKVCLNKYSKDYYNNSLDYQKKRTKHKKEATITINMINIFNYLKEHNCIDCGNDNPILLDFDHRDDVEKINEISNLVKSWTWLRLMTEIDKCDVRCANCHRIRTAKQQGWYKYLIINNVLDKDYNIINNGR